MRSELDAVRGALTLAAHVLVADPAQLDTQLVGRMVEGEEPGFVRLRADVLKRAKLWPLLPSLTTPGGPLLATVSARTAASANALGGMGTVAVHTIAMFPDGRTAAIGYEDGEIHALDVETGVRLWARHHDPDIMSLAVDPRRGLIVSGSADGTVRILDGGRGDDLGTLGRHDQAVRKIAVSPDGWFAFSASLDGVLRAWDLDDRCEIGRLSATGPFALAPDGRRVFGVAVDGSLRAWDVATLADDLICLADVGGALAMAVTPDGEHLVTVSHDVFGSMADEPEKQLNRVVLEVHDLNGNEAPARGTHVEPATGMYHPYWADLDVAADSSFAVSGSLSGHSLFWDLTQIDHPTPLVGHTTQVVAVAITPDTRRVLTGSRDGTIRIWDPARAGYSPHVAAHPGEVNGIAATPDGRRAVSVASDGSAAVWDLLPARAGHAVPCRAGPCWSVAVSDDGAHAVVGGSDGLVVVLDLESGTETARLALPDGGFVSRVGCSPTGGQVWAVGLDGSRVRWDVDAGTRPEQSAPTVGPTLFGWAATPDGSRAVAGRPDGSVVTADLGDAESMRTLGRHRVRVASAAVTPDGRVGLTGSADGEIIVWDLERFEVRQRLAAHDATVMALAMTPDGRLAASAGWDSRLAVWDLERGAKLASFSTDGRLISVALSANGMVCVAGEQSGRVHALLLAVSSGSAETEASLSTGAAIARPIVANDLASARAEAGRCEQLLAADPPNPEHARRLALAYGALATLLGAEGSAERLGYAIRARDLLLGLQTSGVVLGADELETLHMMDEVLSAAAESLGVRFAHLAIASESLHAEPSGPVLVHGAPVLAVCAMPDGRVVSAGADGLVRVWDLATGTERLALRGHDAAVFAVAVTPDSRLVVSGSWDDTVRVWDATSGAELQVLRGHEGGVFAVAVTPDGRHLVSGSGDRSLRVWDLATGAVLQTWRGHEARVMAVTVAADGRLVVSGSEDGTLRLWDFDTGDSRVLAGHESGVLAVAIAPRDDRVVSGSFDQTIKVWDLGHHVSTATLAGHYDAIRAVVLTPDGRRLASAFFDGSIRVWDLVWNAEVATLIGHTDAATALALLPDDRRLVSGSNDGTVQVWDLLLQGHSGELGAGETP